MCAQPEEVESRDDAPPPSLGPTGKSTTRVAANMCVCQLFSLSQSFQKIWLILNADNPNFHFSIRKWFVH